MQCDIPHPVAHSSSSVPCAIHMMSSKITKRTLITSVQILQTVPTNHSKLHRTLQAAIRSNVLEGNLGVLQDLHHVRQPTLEVHAFWLYKLQVRRGLLSSFHKRDCIHEGGHIVKDGARAPVYLLPVIYLGQSLQREMHKTRGRQVRTFTAETRTHTNICTVYKRMISKVDK